MNYNFELGSTISQGCTISLKPFNCLLSSIYSNDYLKNGI